MYYRMNYLFFIIFAEDIHVFLKNGDAALDLASSMVPSAKFSGIRHVSQLHFHVNRLEN